jgi:dihydrofolate reductase
MGRIVVSENVSLDGVVQDPGGDEGFARGGWFGQVSDRDRTAWAELMLDEALAAEALLLGRRSDEWFATRWSSREGEWADRLNGMPKYVVSGSGHDARWSNATVLTAATVAALRDELAGEIVVYASGRLVHLLWEHDLVDELRLTVYPVVLGAGDRLFGTTDAARRLRLFDSRALGDDLVVLTYRRRREEDQREHEAGGGDRG